MLLTSKLSPPRVTATFVDRPRLYAHLDRWRDQRALLIQAPAGYGKSSLVSRWIACRPDQLAYAWLSLDESDAEPRQFVRYLAAALAQTLPDLADVVQPILDDPQGQPRRALLHLLIALQTHLSERAEHLLLVLDDLHRVESPEVDAYLQTVLEHGPETLHLMLLTRPNVSLPLGRLVARHEVSLLTKADLRFTKVEMRAYLLKQGFAPPTEAALARLAAQSEGWVAALQLAVLAAPSEQRDPTELAARLQSHAGWLAAFLTEEVLNRQTPLLRRFLLQTSILDAFNAPLAAAVTGAENAYALLGEVVDADLFLTGLDERGEWFRYHHLFQTLLQQRLRVELSAAAIADCRRRAAAWLAADGQIAEAVHHCLAAGDGDAAAALVEQRVRKELLHDPKAAERLFNLLPRSVLIQHPRLMLARCFLAILYGGEDVIGWRNDAAATVRRQCVTAENAPDLYAEWLVLQGVVAWHEDDLTAAAAYLDEAGGFAHELADEYAGTLHFAWMHLHRHAGDDGSMAQAAEAALAAYERAGFWLGAVALRREQARRTMSRGRAAAAVRQFDEIFRRYEGHGFGVAGEIAVAHWVAAGNHYLQNQLDQARRHQVKALALAHRLDRGAIIRGARVLEHILTLAERKVDARPDELPVQFKEANANRSMTLLQDYETRLLLSPDYRANAAIMATRWGVDLAGPLPAAKDRVLIPFLRLYLAAGRDLEAITLLLEEALAHARATQKRLEELELLALSTWQQLDLYDLRFATETLTKAEALARETGYVRVLLDIPEIADALLQLNLPLGNTLNQRGDRLPGADPQVSLTPQEQRVLNLLAAELTYQQIGDELVISVNTVRTHVRQIYKKLSVTRRDRAIAVARRWQLMTSDTTDV